MSADGKLYGLFRQWLDLRESCNGKDDDATAHIADEIVAVEREILAGKAVTTADTQAQVAMLTEYALNSPLTVTWRRSPRGIGSSSLKECHLALAGKSCALTGNG